MTVDVRTERTRGRAAGHAFAAGVLLLALVVPEQLNAQASKAKRRPTPTVAPTIPTALPLTIDQKKFEALYRAGKALELAAFVKAQQDFKVELSIAADHVSGALEASLVAAYKEVDRRAGLLGAREACERDLRENDASYQRSRAECMKISPTAYSKQCLEGIQSIYEATKVKMQRLCPAEVMEMTGDEVKKSLREAEAIYLGKPLAPSATPTPTGTANQSKAGKP